MKYRLQADSDAYNVIAERNCDPRWQTPNPRIDIDPRSRYFDIYDPDCPPMPADDPASHQYMHCVDGMKGWKYWDQNGQRFELENPTWYESMAEYAEIGDAGAIKLDMDSALRLAYVHSPTHQRQLETMYLTALDVTAERFRLDTQYFGGYDVAYNHNGSLVPASLGFDPAVGQFVVSPPFDGDGVEINRLTVGRTSASNPALEASRRFATAGQLLVGFANSFVFEFTGADANLSASLLNFSFIQPLLRGAGRDIALEDLTRTERTLLANMRAYGQFRQGFYTQVAIGESGVNELQRFGTGTNLQSFGGQGFVGGYLGLLLQLQQIRNSENNLALQLRTLARLEAFLEADQIGRIQVEQFRQNIQIERDSLLQARLRFELALDRYKTDTLGLPPDVPIELDETLIRQFQLLPTEGRAVQDEIAALQIVVGELPGTPDVQDLEAIVRDAPRLLEPLQRQFEDIDSDLRGMDDSLRTRQSSMTEDQLASTKQERAQLARLITDRKEEFADAQAMIRKIQSELRSDTTQATRRALIVWITDLLQIVERASLVQARARLEMITVPEINLDSPAAYEIALGNRLDFMNGRASLVDTWRRIQVSADALQSVLNLTANGDLRTARNNPADFRAPTGSVRLGVEFDAPFTRLLERNTYRESLINYQRDRRNFIQSRDSLHLGLRALLRQLDQLRTSLEIQRQAVAIAILRVDLTQADLVAPRERSQLGARARLNPTTAINLLSAQASLLQTQNSFLNVWLNYYAARIRLYRELGIMSLAPDGTWVEYPLPDFSSESAAGDNRPFGQDGSALDDGDEPPLPPQVPGEFIDLIERLPDVPDSAPSIEPLAYLPEADASPAEFQSTYQSWTQEYDRVRRLSFLPGERPQ